MLRLFADGPGHRIAGGTARVIDMRDIETQAGRLFEGEEVAFIQLRSSINNGYHFRIERRQE